MNKSILDKKRWYESDYDEIDGWTIIIKKSGLIEQWVNFGVRKYVENEFYGAAGTAFLFEWESLSETNKRIVLRKLMEKATNPLSMLTDVMPINIWDLLKEVEDLL